MTIEEIREDILHKLESINDEATLQRIMDFIESYESSVKGSDVDDFYKRLKAQHSDVLHKLSQ